MKLPTVIPAACPCAAVELGDDETYGTLWGAVFVVAKHNQPPFVEIPDEVESVTMEEIELRASRTKSIGSLQRAETQALKLYMALVDLFDSPVDRVVESGGEYHTLGSIKTTSFVYFLHGQSHKGIYAPGAIAFKEKLTGETKITPAAMLYDYAYTIPEREYP